MMKTSITVMSFLVGVWACSFVWAYDVIEVVDGGTISGEVKFAGTPPPPEKLEVTKDTEVCGKTEKLSEALVVGANKGIHNAVVFLANVQKGKKLEVPAKNSALDQKDCQYVPHVLSFPAGSTLDILNSDGILHNIHTHSEKNPAFNQAQPKFKKVINKKFDQPETVKVTCDVHGWMSGWFVVQDHPYYAVTDANGAFRLTDVPPGDYELKVWHETLGGTTQKVSVKSKEDKKISVELAKK